jgi:exosortase/archaeosortase family protein
MVIGNEAFATPNDGSQGAPPSGGGGKTSVPAPFGFLFLTLGAMLSSAFKRYLPTFKVQHILLLGAIVLGVTANLIDLHAGLLFALPVLGVCFSNTPGPTKQLAPSDLLMVGVTLTIGIIKPEWFAFAVLSWVTLTVAQSALPYLTKSVLALSSFSALLILHPLVGPVDGMLQENFAYLATSVLQIFGVPVFQQGDQIMGLATSISVTKACVGTSVVANTIALCAFVSVLFMPTRKQLKVCLQMISVILCLNVLRIAVITYLGNFFFQSTLSQLHDILGVSLAVSTYLFVSAWVYWHWHQNQQASKT